jgi:hypothetical protein
MRWRLIGWGVPVVLLLLPLIAGAPWTGSDYATAGALFLVAGLTIELAMRSSRDGAFRAGAGIAVAAAFLLLWVNLAVGFLGDEGNRANLLFVLVIALALAGGMVARFRAAGLARAMFVTAAAQVLVGMVALGAGWATPGRAGLYEVVLGTGLFTALWLAASWLFARSARGRGVTAHPG